MIHRWSTGAHSAFNLRVSCAFGPWYVATVKMVGTHLFLAAKVVAVLHVEIAEDILDYIEVEAASWLKG
jgi:hypothetical protein